MGRNMEGYTEDPYLDSRIATNIVEGAQGIEHRCSRQSGGVDDRFSHAERARQRDGARRDRIFRAVYSREFSAPVDCGLQRRALGVMAGYPEIEDIPEHASEKWNTQILRNELGFKGVVDSEGGGFGTLLYEHIVPTQKEAGALALRAGVDLDITYEPAYMGPLIENVQEGKFPKRWSIAPSAECSS